MQKNDVMGPTLHKLSATHQQPRLHQHIEGELSELSANLQIRRVRHQELIQLKNPHRAQHQTVVGETFSVASTQMTKMERELKRKYLQTQSWVETLKAPVQQEISGEGESLELSAQQEFSAQQELSVQEELSEEQELSAQEELSEEQELSAQQELSEEQELSAQQELSEENEPSEEQKLSVQQELSEEQELSAQHKLLAQQELSEEHEPSEEQKLSVQ